MGFILLNNFGEYIMVTLEMVNEVNCVDAGYKIISYINHRNGSIYDYIADICAVNMIYPYAIEVEENHLNDDCPLLTNDHLGIIF